MTQRTIFLDLSQVIEKLKNSTCSKSHQYLNRISYNMANLLFLYRQVYLIYDPSNIGPYFYEHPVHLGAHKQEVTVGFVLL
jgi:hypothetical protein